VERGGAGVVSTRNRGIEGELARDASRTFQNGGESSLSLVPSSSSLFSSHPCIVRRYMFLFLFDELLILILR